MKFWVYGIHECAWARFSSPPRWPLRLVVRNYYPGTHCHGNIQEPHTLLSPGFPGFPKVSQGARLSTISKGKMNISVSRARSSWAHGFVVIRKHRSVEYTGTVKEALPVKLRAGNTYHRHLPSCPPTGCFFISSLALMNKSL